MAPIDGISFRILLAEPGDYLPVGYMIGNLKVNMSGQLPAVHVEAGKIVYAGNIRYSTDRKARGMATYVGFTPEAANRFLRQYPKILGEVSTTEPRLVNFTCHHDYVPFTSGHGLHCDQEKSKLEWVILQTDMSPEGIVAEPTADAPATPVPSPQQ